ncbi:MAG: class I mannose-6-phosphate isomerase [Alistipes sp.]|jgi:mannose-6-phosphate isomerase|nr:class I mannose-6-phosphate isomerase [Alistipes sp.]MBO7266030.1 class I mannose-6-phosphate isomerase [Alistipes sp.]
MLYPIKFKPRVKERIWGGKAILERKGKAVSRLAKDKLYGESWDLSSVKGDVSVVANGMLKGNNLEEIIEVYMGELVGEQNFERYGLEFPLLIKYLDCNDRLSVQVHPDDALAMERHDSYGKTEAWYIAECKEGAAIYLGFKDLNTTREEYIAAVSESRLESMLNRVEVKKGDIFFIPAGTVHALGAGIEVVEVQQTSDITYRIYDWDRVDAEGKGRELHTALAVDAIDFEADAELLHKQYDVKRGGEAKVIESPYFTMAIQDVDGHKLLDRSALDSFVVYICLEGSATISADGAKESLAAGELVLVPAECCEVEFEGEARLMEVYIK